MDSLLGSTGCMYSIHNLHSLEFAHHPIVLSVQCILSHSPTHSYAAVLRAHFVHCWFNFFRKFHFRILWRAIGIWPTTNRDLPRGLAARTFCCATHLPLAVPTWVCIFFYSGLKKKKKRFRMNFSFRIRLDFFTNHVSNTNQLHNFE